MLMLYFVHYLINASLLDFPNCVRDYELKTNDTYFLVHNKVFISQQHVVLYSAYVHILLYDL